MDTISLIVGIVVGALAGAGIVYVFLKKAIEKKGQLIIEEAKNEGEVIKKEKILQAKVKKSQQKIVMQNLK